MIVSYITDLNWVQMNWDNSIWPVLKPAVMRQPQELTGEQVRDEVLNQKFDLWRIEEDDGTVKGYGVSITLRYVHGLCVYVRYIAGKGLSKWITEAWPVWCEFLRAHGIKYITMGGRMGWARAMKAQFGPPVAVILMKELS